MNKHNIQDERILIQRRKISSEAYSILMIVLIFSILVQQFVLNAPFKQYAVEFMCFFGMSLYTIVRYLMLGLNLYGESKWARKIPLLNGIVTGVVVTTINGILNYSKYADKYKADGIGYFIAVLAVTFISATIGSFIILAFISFLNDKKQATILRGMDEEEEDL